MCNQSHTLLPLSRSCVDAFFILLRLDIPYQATSLCRGPSHTVWALTSCASCLSLYVFALLTLFEIKHHALSAFLRKCTPYPTQAPTPMCRLLLFGDALLTLCRLFLPHAMSPSLHSSFHIQRGPWYLTQRFPSLVYPPCSAQPLTSHSGCPLLETPPSSLSGSGTVCCLFSTWTEALLTLLAL